MKAALFVLILGLVGVSFAVPADAFPTLEVTACDTLEVNPLRVRTTFEISSVYGATYSAFIIHPYPGSAAFLECASPPGWHCSREEEPPYVYFLPDASQWHGERVAGFSFVSDQAAPCVLIIFESVVLGSEYSMQACLHCDAPVPSRTKSWGSIKSVYR